MIHRNFNTTTDCLDNYPLVLKGDSFSPIIQGGMGVDISTKKLALTIARLGGIGTVSDAMILSVCDKNQKTSFTKKKFEKYSLNTTNRDKSMVTFDLHDLYEAQKTFVASVIKEKLGNGNIFINIMEKLTMNGSKATLRTRLLAALDGGIDGVTLSAGLHLNSFSMIKDHPRFHEVKLGIIVSSLRSLSLFLRKCRHSNRLPDFIIVEGPLAGGHLGFGNDWRKFNLAVIIKEIKLFLQENELSIPLIAAGGVFTGADGLECLEHGASGIQIATRFTVAKECGLPTSIKQKYYKAKKSDVVVNTVSPTGYFMRMLKSSPAIKNHLKPNCEAFGYLLNDQGKCQYAEEYYQSLNDLSNLNKTCLCANMLGHRVYTCGANVWRLKETSSKINSGAYRILKAEDIFNEYLYNTVAV